MTEYKNGDLVTDGKHTMRVIEQMIDKKGAIHYACMIIEKTEVRKIRAEKLKLLKEGER